ncbi:hypothetical protein As57867_007262, partial [Aphanomyces stellatus]
MEPSGADADAPYTALGSPRRDRQSNGNGGTENGQRLLSARLLPMLAVSNVDTTQRRPSSETTQAKLEIKMGSQDAGGKASSLAAAVSKPRNVKAKYLADFTFNLELALRAAVGTVLSAMLMTKTTTPNGKHTESQWFLFPHWYIFGGLSNVAMACVFGSGNNMGATVREICQQIGGVGTALLYNVVVYVAMWTDVCAVLPSLP